MKLLNNIRNYIGEDEFRLILYSDKIDIINYDKINEISNEKIIIQSNKKIIIEGKNLEIIKLLDDEVLIKGIFKDILLNE